MAYSTILRSLPQTLIGSPSPLNNVPGANPITAVRFNAIKSKIASGQKLTNQEALDYKGATTGEMQTFGGDPTNNSTYQGQVPKSAGGNAGGYTYNPNTQLGPYSGGAGTRGMLGPSLSESNSANNAASLSERSAGNDSTYNQQVPIGGGGRSNTSSVNGSSYNPSIQDPIAASATDPYIYKNYPTLNLPDAPLSTITPKDFSTQAGEMAAKAYAPSYAALDTGRANVGTNYTLADKVVAGLYENLAKGNTQKQDASTARYAAAAKAGATDAAATQKTIGAGYQSAQSDEAKTLASLGIQAAAPGSLKATSNAQAQQQGAAAQNSANQAANLTSQASNQNDYQSNQGSADASQGLADRSSLLNTRNTTLGQYDAQQEVVAGQQGQQALSVGQGLTTQDLSAQQTNASLKQQQYSNTVQNLMNQYNTGVANMQYQDTQNATQYDRAVAANSAEYARGQQQWQNAFDTAGQQGNLGVDITNANTGATQVAWDVDPRNPKNYYKQIPVDPNTSPDAQVRTKYLPEYTADPEGFNDKITSIKATFTQTNGVNKGDSPLAIKNAAINGYKGSHPNWTQNDIALVAEMAIDWANGMGSQTNTGSTP